MGAYIVMRNTVLGSVSTIFKPLWGLLVTQQMLTDTLINQWNVVVTFVSVCEGKTTFTRWSLVRLLRGLDQTSGPVWNKKGTPQRAEETAGANILR